MKPEQVGTRVVKSYYQLLEEQIYDAQVSVFAAPAKTPELRAVKKRKQNQPRNIGRARRPRIEPESKIIGTCETCYCSRMLFRHHLIPQSITRKRHRRKSATVLICFKCHTQIHQTPNKILADQFNTLEKVKELLGRNENTLISEGFSR
jgi:hypothetical protein